MVKKRKYYLVISRKKKNSNHFFGAFPKNPLGLLEAKRYKELLEKQNGEKYSIK